MPPPASSPAPVSVSSVVSSGSTGTAGDATAVRQSLAIGEAETQSAAEMDAKLAALVTQANRPNQEEPPSVTTLAESATDPRKRLERQRQLATIASSSPPPQPQPQPQSGRPPAPSADKDGTGAPPLAAGPQQNLANAPRIKFPDAAANLSSQSPSSSRFSFLACCFPFFARRTSRVMTGSAGGKSGAAAGKNATGTAGTAPVPTILSTSIDTPMDDMKQQLGKNKVVLRPPPLGPRGPNNPPRYLLKPPLPEDFNKKCLVLDLDETLIHSSFKPVSNPDYIVPVEIENQIHNVYVLKRPYVDEFLRRLGPHFEIVVFTASLSKYADPVIDNLDKNRVVRHRLFREACINHRGSFVKDLSQLGRDLKNVIIVDNSPVCYTFHPYNAVPCTSWFDDPNDAELLDLIPFLEDLRMVENVMAVLDSANADDEEEETGAVRSRRRR